jgi:hypothetical protein
MNSRRIGGRRAVAFALLTGLALPSAPGGVSLDALNAGAADLQQLAASYVDDYQKQLTAIVADEVYRQAIRRQEPEDDGAPRARTTRGEVFFLFAAAEREWMAIRDVREVDGAPVSGGANVRETLRTLPPGRVAERMKAYNARYNIGRVVRNINEPTLALLVLDGAHRSRFKFKSGRSRVLGGRALVPLSFRERERPTLIRSSTGAPIYTSGELLVEPGTGRVWESTLDASVDAIKVRLTTEYSFDERLDLLLPTLFRERYEQGQPSSASGKQRVPYELIEAQGEYSNFRRFEVLSRVR